MGVTKVTVLDYRPVWRVKGQTTMAVNNNKWSDADAQLLKMVSEGYAVKDIANKIGKSPATVHYHASRMYMKLGARNSANAVAIAFRKGILK